jgi:hypothetical protein
MDKSINYKRINPPVRELSCNHARLSPSQAGGFVRLKRSDGMERMPVTWQLAQTGLEGHAGAGSPPLTLPPLKTMAGVGYDNFGNKGVEKATNGKSATLTLGEPSQPTKPWRCVWEGNTSTK